MRNSVKRPLFALFTFLLVIGSPAAGEPDTIIPEQGTSIQLIYTSSFDDWPGVSGISPINVSVANERTWLIWPESIINLNPDGRMDEQTLLTLYASQTADWDSRRWTPENGVVCSDGFWRGFYSDGKTFAQLNLQNGEIQTSPWNRPVPDSIYPAYDGNLLILTGAETGLVKIPELTGEQLYEPLETGTVPLTLAAVSTELPLAAWKDVDGNKMHIADFSGKRRVFSIDTANLPEIPAWSMDWVGDKLAIAYPGELVVVNFHDNSKTSLEKLTESHIPSRWYRLRGGADRLVIQSPENGTLAIFREKERGNDSNNRPDNRGFAALVESYALEAGDLLEKKGDMNTAEKFYGWLLPYVREARSLKPLEEAWPELESELATRRLNLRSRLN